MEATASATSQNAGHSIFQVFAPLFLKKWYPLITQQTLKYHGCIDFSYFFLDEKVGKKSSRKDAAHPLFPIS
ncbi:MAG: hypothetical protein H6608_05985 [Flavobacteriales bacterium]|nr:hypothetical protein [Flavobacteriales bacterium]